MNESLLVNLDEIITELEAFEAYADMLVDTERTTMEVA
jgi:hypothetical protein